MSFCTMQPLANEMEGPQQQRAAIKHMERYTNITVTKIMLVSVICLVLHKNDEIHSGFSNAVLFNEAVK